MRKRLWTLCAILLLWSLPSHAAIYYVATTGSNGNAGTSAGAAWATLQHAHDNASSGDTINVLAGQYYQRVTITKSSLTWTGQVGTIVDGTDALTGWSHQGSGMYRVATPGYTPGGMTALNPKLTIPHFQNSYMNGSYTSCGVTALQAMQLSASAPCGGSSYWDGFEAVFGTTGGFVYMRFRDSENPNNMSVRVGPNDTGTFTINGGDSNTIQDMEIGAAMHAIRIRSGGDNNVIRNCYLRNGIQQVYVDSSSGNQFVNNTVRMQWIGAVSGYASPVVLEGNWDDPAIGSARRMQYNHDKFEDADGGEHSGGFKLAGVHNTIISGNDIRGGTVGIHTEGGSNYTIRGNWISNCSAECIFWYSGSPMEISHNVFDESEHLIRIQRMEEGGKTGYIFRNHWHQTFEGAKHIHFSFIVRGVSPNTIYVYHNTFTGRGWAADLGPGDSGTTSTMANVRYVNNILTGLDMDISSSGVNGNPGTHGYLGMWSYNHCSMGCSISGANNYVSNTTGGTNPIWSDPLNAVLLPATGHAALDSAIRLDQNWTIGGTTRSALPGMAGGYYTDSTPHRGAWQEDETEAPPADPPQPNITGSGAAPGKKYGRYGGFKIPDDACNMACQRQRRWEEMINEHRGMQKDELVGALEQLRDRIFR
ncbi:MAG TPA: right-handed parallel beta-helix repeat-containing protein [Candidatus Tectomicrobia bacterium]